jgi:DNA ligase-1
MIAKMKSEIITVENWNKLEQISSVSSLIEKKNLCSEFLSDDSFRKLILYSYNPYKVYKIKKISSACYAIARTLKEYTEETFEDFLDYLASLDGVGNVTIGYVAKFIYDLDDTDLSKLVLRVLNKDLKCGVGIKMWNECGYNIPTFNVQLAHSPSHLEKFLEENEKFIIQYKLDGNRLIANIHGNNVNFYSRNGKEINSLDFLKPELIRINNQACGGNFTQIDGEILHKSMELYQCQEIVSRKDSSHGRGKELDFFVFDMLAFNGNDLTEKPQIIRLTDLWADFFKKENGHQIKFTDYSVVEGIDREAIWSYYKTARKENYEGLILKNMFAPYEGKRSRNWVKIKPRDTLDLTVIELKEGKTDSKYSGQMGAAVVDFNGIPVSVGGGWSDDQRTFYWENPNELIGHVIEVAYMMETKDGSLLHPRVLRIRDDKF